MRPDRDQYVEILWQNILDGIQHNFEIMRTDEWEDLGEPYDFKSVMHYEGDNGSINGKPTIVYAGTNTPVSIVAKELSSIDIHCS